MLSKSLVTRLEYQHETIADLLQDLSPEDMNKRLSPKKWSIAENVAHLGRYQEVFLDRIKKIINEDKPVFGRYKAEIDKSFEKWLEMSTDEVIESIDIMGKEIFHTINNLTSLGLTKKGKHPKLGWMDITEWAEFYLLHEAHHIYTIFWLKNELKA